MSNLNRGSRGVARLLIVVSAWAGFTGCVQQHAPAVLPPSNPSELPTFAAHAATSPPSFHSCTPKPTTDPVLREGGTIVYPPRYQSEGIEGYSIVYVTIDATGTLMDVEGVEAGAPQFLSSAKFSMADWQFEPARLDGSPVSVRCLYRIEYVLVDLRDVGSSAPADAKR